MPLIVLEGIDKAGKDTQSKLLEGRLAGRGLRVKCISFPDYGTPIGKEIKKFLQGKLDLRPEVRQLLYVANRWERQRDLEEWLEKGMYVIADRYIPSGLVYGLANGLNLNWMLKLEEGLPAADIIIVIDISAEASYHREKKKDIYEKDMIFLGKVRSSYLELARKFNWLIINGEMSVDEVSQRIWENILTFNKNLGNNH